MFADMILMMMNKLVIVSRCWLVTLNASQPENYSSVHFPMGSPTTHCSVLHSLYFFCANSAALYVYSCMFRFLFLLFTLDRHLFFAFFLTDLYFFSGNYSIPHCGRLCSQCVLRISKLHIKYISKHAQIISHNWNKSASFFE